MQERGNGMTLAGDSLSGLPSRMLVRLVDGRTKHTFYIRDLLHHMQTRLFNSDYFIPEPLVPTNPFTGMALSESNQMRIFLLAFSPDVYVPLHSVLRTYWRVGLNVDSLQKCERVMLHEMAIVNEPRQAGSELLDELGDMYNEAGLDVLLVPSVAVAQAINSVDVLLSTHTQAFITYFLIHRSWCEYTSQCAKQNLAVHCAAALVAYSEKTLEQRKRYWTEDPPSLPPSLAPSVQLAQVEPDTYDNEEQDDAVLIMTRSEDLEILRRWTAVAVPTFEEDRPRLPTPLVSPEEYIIFDTPFISPDYVQRDDEHYDSAVADTDEIRVIIDEHDSDEERQNNVIDLKDLERQSHRSRQTNVSCIDDEQVDKVAAFADEYLRPLSLEAETVEDSRPWARAAIQRVRSQVQQQQKVEEPET